MVFGRKRWPPLLSGAQCPTPKASDLWAEDHLVGGQPRLVHDGIPGRMMAFTGDASANKMDNDGSIHLHTGSIGHCRHVLIMVCKSTGTVQQLESYSGKAFELSFFLLNVTAIPISLQTIAETDCESEMSFYY